VTACRCRINSSVGKRSETTQVRSEHWHIAPRFGFAYRYNDKTSIRGGYGIFTMTNQADNLNVLQLNSLASELDGAECLVQNIRQRLQAVKQRLARRIEDQHTPSHDQSLDRLLAAVPVTNLLQ
jgi:hypothetical protein